MSEKDKDEAERLRSIVPPVPDDLERISRVQKVLARLCARNPKEKKPPSEKSGAAHIYADRVLVYICHRGSVGLATIAKLNS